MVNVLLAAKPQQPIHDLVAFRRLKPFARLQKHVHHPLPLPLNPQVVNELLSLRWQSKERSPALAPGPLVFYFFTILHDLIPQVVNDLLR